MSDTPQSPDWWQAVDGTWHPPPPPHWPATDSSGQGATGRDPFGALDRRSRAPLTLAVVVAVGVVIVVGVVTLGTDGGSDGTSAERDGIEAAEPPLGPDRSAGSGEEIPEFVDPSDAEPVTVVEHGFSMLVDESDPDVQSLTYGVVLENPNPSLAASGIELAMDFFDEAGNEVVTQTDFVSVVLPGDRIGFGNLVFDAGTAPVRMEVSAEAGQFVAVDDDRLDGQLTTRDVETAPEEFGGFVTRFVIDSSYDEPVSDVTVGGLFRDAAGGLVGGYFSYVESVEAGGSAPGELLVFLDVPDMATVELFPNVGFDFVFPS